MKKFFNGIAIIFTVAICVFLVGATLYALNPDFKSWVDTDIIQTVEKDTVDVPIDGGEGGLPPNIGTTEDPVVSGDDTTSDEGEEETIVLAISWR